jgi:hypothetical protein
MSDHPELHIKIFGLSVSAEGALAIGAALLIVFGFLGFCRF